MSEVFHAGDKPAGAAVVAADDEETQAIVERELAEAGIECFFEGSIVYSVQVHSRELARAREVLRSSIDLKGRWIQFPAE